MKIDRLGALIIATGVLGLAAIALLFPTASEIGADGSLLQTEASEIDELHVWTRSSDTQPPPVHLVRAGSGWTIRSSHGYPAVPSKVDGLLDALHAARGTSEGELDAAALPAMELADDRFTRRIDLVSSGARLGVVLGAKGPSGGPWWRFQGSGEVFAVRGLNPLKLPSHDQLFWEANYVDAGRSTIASVTVRNPHETIVVEMVDHLWFSRGMPAGWVVDQASFDRLLDRTLVVRLDGVAGVDVQPEHGLDAGTRVSWTYTDGTDGGYVFGPGGDDGRCFVKADDSPFVVTALYLGLRHLEQLGLQQIAAPDGGASPATP